MLTRAYAAPSAPSAPSVSPRQTVASGFNTASIATGRMVFLAAGLVVSYTDSRVLESSLAAGVYTGAPAQVTLLGLELVHFSDASPAPVVGERVWLAAADDDPFDGAAGKVTTLAPATGFAVPVGSVLSIPVDFATTHKATVFVRIGELLERAS